MEMCGPIAEHLDDRTLDDAIGIEVERQNRVTSVEGIDATAARGGPYECVGGEAGQYLDAFDPRAHRVVFSLQPVGFVVLLSGTGRMPLLILNLLRPFLAIAVLVFGSFVPSLFRSGLSLLGLRLE